MSSVCSGSQQFVRAAFMAVSHGCIPVGFFACPVCRVKVAVDGYGRTQTHLQQRSTNQGATA